MTSGCQCEHAAHFGKGLTPNKNPGHRYNQNFLQLVKVLTPYGNFIVCPDCRTDCFGDIK